MRIKQIIVTADASPDTASNATAALIAFLVKRIFDGSVRSAKIKQRIATAAIIARVGNIESAYLPSQMNLTSIIEHSKMIIHEKTVISDFVISWSINAIVGLNLSVM